MFLLRQDEKQTQGMSKGSVSLAHKSNEDEWSVDWLVWTEIGVLK